MDCIVQVLLPFCLIPFVWTSRERQGTIYIYSNNPGQLTSWLMKDVTICPFRLKGSDKKTAVLGIELMDPLSVAHVRPLAEGFNLQS